MDYLSVSVGGVINAPETLWVAAIVAIALFTRAAIGFGDGIIAVPLLSLMMELREAVPFILFLSTTMSFVSMWRDRAHIQFSSLKRTSVLALCGFPIGIGLLGLGNNDVVKAGLGLMLVLLAIWNLSPSKEFRLKADGWSYVFGLAAGVLGAAYAMRGIVFAIYGTLRGWSPSQFKGTIHSFYITSGVLIPFSYFAAGMVTQRVVGLYLVMLPLAAIVTVIGIWSTGRLNPALFQRIIWSVLCFLGAAFLLQYLFSG